MKPTRAAVSAFAEPLSGATQNHLDTIGQVCLLGRSNGCALTLGLAAELNARGINDLTFVGLSDVPMWDTGRDPPVRKVGSFMPKNHPGSSGAKSPHMWSGVNPVSDVPLLKLDTEINAKPGNKINLYQTQGNHMKPAHHASRWMWTSDFSEGEVHGHLDGFDNCVFSAHEAPGYTTGDLGFHVWLNCYEPWKWMCGNAATAFADFPE